MVAVCQPVLNYYLISGELSPELPLQ